MKLADIQEQREKLTQNYNRYLSALDAVAELISSDPVAPEVQVEAPTAPRQKPVKVARVSAPKSPRVKAPKASGKRNGDEIAAFAAKLPQPFTPAQLAQVAGLDSTRNAGNYIMRWKRAGLVKKVGYCQWERTAKFPGTAKPAQETPASKPARVAVPGDPVAQTDEEKFAATKAEWLKAHQSGQTTLEQILADKVSDLEERMAAGEK